MALMILKIRSLRPDQSRTTSVMTQPGLEWLTTTFPFLGADTVTCSAISWTAYISRSLERLYLILWISGLFSTGYDVRVLYLSSILAFFLSESASKMCSSLRSGNCVMKWTNDVTNTRLMIALGQFLIRNGRGKVIGM